MKKKLLLSLFSLLCAIFLVACGGDSKSDKKNNTTASEQSEGGFSHNLGTTGDLLPGQTTSKVALNTEYLKVLPSNSWVLMKLDLDNLLNKSDILKHSDVKDLFESRIAEQSKNIKSLLKSIYDNPSKSGVDVACPIFFAITGFDVRDKEPSRGLLTLAISDVKAFETTLLTLSKDGLRIKEKYGMKCIVEDEYNVEIAYDAHKLIIAFDKYEANISNYLNLQQDMMAVNSKKFEPIFKGSEDLMIAANLYPIVNAVMNEFRLSDYKTIVDPFISDYAMFVSLNFAKGSADFKVNSNLPAAYTEPLNKFFKPGSKRHFKYLPRHCYAVFNYGIDLTQLNINPLAKMMGITPEYAKITNDLLNKIKGDITFATWINGYNFEDGENHQFMFALDCPDKSLFETLKSMLEMKMDLDPTEISKDVYALNINRRVEYNYYTYEYEQVRHGYDYYLMYKDGAIMVMPETLYEQISYTGEFKPLKKNVSDNRIFASMSNGLVLEPSPIREILSSRTPNSNRQNQADKEMLDVLRMVEKLTVTFDFFNFNASLKLSDGNTNSLKTIVYKIIDIAQQEEERRKEMSMYD